uniref:non-specific serine/threonine protein kinase n=1 Tax=Kalanchoe fedtschenkoi TaxID=63787 RepID=A0A7N0ULA5_KALFE
MSSCFPVRLHAKSSSLGAMHMHALINRFFFFLLLLLHISNAAPPTTPILLSCGGNGGKDTDGRQWESDSKYVTATGNSQTSSAAFQDPSLPSAVPYMNARVFMAEASYKLPVEPDSRYYLRLHFYPSTYTSLDPTTSYFSAVANGVTLLNNFSASITAQALTQAYIVKEYALPPLQSTALEIIFRPSDKHSGSFAFINGVELIPIPSHLFGTASMVGFEGGDAIDEQSSNMETMVRLNAGGQYISPANDSLARTWYDDTPYLAGAVMGVTSKANGTIVYEDLPQYVAPPDVYSTSRSMGYSKDLAQSYNLTWVFQVDANFTYITRLHFCEYDESMANQIVFDIYLNGKMAYQGADIIGWSGGKDVPTYKDYAFYVSDGLGDENITLQLHPNTEAHAEYLDARLNGVEVFKVGDANKNLAGPNPVPSPMLLKAEAASTAAFATPGSDNTHIKVIGGAAGGAAAFSLVAALCVAVYHRKKRVVRTNSHTSSWLPVYTNSHTSVSKSTISGKGHASSHFSSRDGGLCRHFTLPEIKLATKNFDESCVIGVGGFGKVYKGVIDGNTKVAIKRSNPNSEQGVNEFQTEIELLSKLRHRHLVSLIGFCEEDGEMALVYDYMALGTLREHLYKTRDNKPHLSWKQRLEIAIGAARGLHYLHTGAKYTIIHRDVKTTNILLDDNWVAKVSDFGLSKTGPEMNQAQAHVSTVVKGSFGYLDPEYYRRQQLTEKSDVYSFGVVLFEALCGRPALNPSLPKEQVSLGDWALLCIKKGTFEDIIDPHIKGKIKPECLKKYVDVAHKCLADQGIDRPSMGDVLWSLESALQLQENPEAGSKQPKKNSSSEDLTSDEQFTEVSLDHESPSSSSDDSNNAIFSQIVNPKGR